ncbi:AAA family ATPase [Candidatus Poriferisodalis sp.]|uniref:AAA family ATPase n=1 Tax=Candidatus Poriferisodalis sp. TaxID=3101277 RepID=UPI003B011A47
MRLKRITLENFRSYFGRHQLELDCGEDGGLVVLFGENMSGKTALFLALNWCLYGRAIGRRGEMIPVYDAYGADNNVLVNNRAADAETWHMQVSLEWTHQGNEWRLDRSIRSAPEGGGEPGPEEVFLQIDDSQIVRQEIPQRINQVLHRDASQFYFFDGELLSQYERWLEDPQEKDRRVKAAVELTVGTAALRLYSEMDSIAKEAGEAQASLVRKEQRENRLADQLQEARHRSSELTSEIVQYRDQVEDWKTQAAEIQSRYGALVEFSGELGRLSTLEQNVSRNTEKREETERQMQAIVSEQYWIALSNANEELRDQTDRRIQEFLATGIEGSIERLVEKSVLQGFCELCGHELDEVASEYIERQATSISGDQQADQAIASLRDWFDRLEALEEFRPSGGRELLNSLENHRLDLISEIYADGNEAESLRRQHSDRPRSDLEAEMQRLVDINDNITNTEGYIEATQSDLDEQDALIEKLQAQINRISIDPSIQRQAQAARIAVNAMRSALIGFREQARSRVEDGASEVFQRLMADESSGAIRIDEDYRVSPVDDNGDIMPIPSAGGQQLVTLALIGGLNRAAVHDAPMVMDTPAGRIDRGNRSRILKWVGTLPQQTVLMVHSGEYTAEEIAAQGITPSRSYHITFDEFEGSSVTESV